ncbi:MAG: NepR family anti-sigma factor [Pseudomonadota bacterium]
MERNLKRAYEDVAQQELPSRFTDLLAQLKDADAKTARNTDAASEASDDA